MSEYDRFAKWVTKIIQIDLKFVRSIMKGIDQSKGTPAADKKTDTEKAKAFF
jgi:hypothetical protein